MVFAGPHVHYGLWIYLSIAGFHVVLGYPLDFNLLDFLRQSIRSPRTLVEYVAQSREPRFAEELEQGLQHLELEEGVDKFFVKLRKTRSPLPTRIAIPPYDGAPRKKQIEGLEQLRWFENCFTEGALRQYYTYTTHASYDLKNVVDVLSRTFTIPLHEMKISVRGPKDQVIETLRREIPIDLELRQVKGLQYNRTMLELYVVNAAYSIVIGAFLAAVHYGQPWEK
jgi:hypothetical protein